jgi:two-component system cell cycle sensor histidine kinase/response regulator CckA
VQHNNGLHRALRIIAECNRAVHGAREEIELSERICRILVQTGGHLTVWVGYAEQDEARGIRPVACAGAGADSLPSFSSAWRKLKDGGSPAGTAVATGRVSLARRIEAGPTLDPWQTAAREQGYRSSVAFPLAADAQTFGALSIHASTDDAFDDDEVALLGEVAFSLADGVAAQRAAHAAKAARKACERFDKVLNSMPSFMGLLRTDGTLLEINAAALRIAGITREQAVGAQLLELPFWTGAQTTGPIVADAIERASRGETVRVDLRARALDGRLITVDAVFTPVRDEQDRVVEIVASAVDVTERERARQESLASEQRFRQLAETIREVFWMREPGSGKVLYVSPAYETIWGRSCKSLYDAPGDWLAAVHAEDRPWVSKAAMHDVPTGEVDAEYRIVRPDGRVAWIRDRAFPVRDADGHVVRMVGVADDITEPRLLEEQVRQAQKMESVGRLAGGIAHDFNNLLTVMLGNADLISSLVPPDHEVAPLAAEIRRTGERASSLTHQLLAFSRRHVLDLKVLDLNSIVEDVEPMLGRLLGEDVELKTALRARGLVRVDSGQLVQVILNLAVNARDAMSRGGCLRIETADVSIRNGLASGHPTVPQGSYLVLSVIDTGSGITPEVRERLFEPFFTTKEPGKGTGLGLAVVYGIVKQSGGHIEVDSEPGKGTTFRIYLPTVGEQPGMAHLPEQPANGGAGSETVLLVEDNPDVRRITARALRRAGYTVMEASEGREAIQILDRDSAGIDLVLTDVVMPVVGGREISEHVAARYPRIKIVFTSGYTDDAIVRQGVLSADVAFLQKPYTADSLLETVRRALNNRGEHTATRPLSS